MPSRRRAWLTPDTPPPETFRGRCFSVPDDETLVAAVTGALLPLTQPENWEEHGSMSADDTADIMSTAFEAFVSGDCAGETEPCPPPSHGGRRIVRLNPVTGHWEQTTDDGFGWEEPDGTYALPSQVGREELTDEEKMCAAATNAAHTLKLLYDQALADFADEYSAAEILDHFGEVAGTLIAAGLEFLIDALGPWASITFDLFFNGIDIISQNVWTDDFEATLTCLLLRNATITDGIVTFDFQAVNRDLVFEHVSSVDDVLWIAQVEYMLMTIGADGLNLAGETTTVEGDCVDCGTWCVYWDMEHDNIFGSEWEIFEGVENADHSVQWVHYTSGYDGALNRLGVRLTVDTSLCVIKYIGARVFAPSGGGTCYHYRLVTNHTGLATTPYDVFSYSVGTDYDHNSGGQAADASTGASSTIEIRVTTNSSSAFRLRGLKISGTGVNPFVTGTGC